MCAAATLIPRELPDYSGWVIDALWPNRPAEQLLGVFTSFERAAEWIEKGADAWRTRTT